MTALE